MRLVLDDIGADCIKIGMLHRPDVVAAVAGVLRSHAPGVPVVLDPVMVAKGGDALLDPEGAAALKAELIPLASVLTPNLPEAEALCSAGGVHDPLDLARRLLALGPEAVLVKGGHGEGDVIVDLLACRGGEIARFQSDRIASRHTHGTGCTLASAIATGLAQRMAVTAAVERARAYVLEAIRTAPGYGSGHGPLNHGHTVRPFVPAAG
jgi:hydroxymethylpyrimidine/phosphomethylpyrimidine kinase